MAEKSVITNIEARIRQLIDDHKRLSESCAELTAQRDNLKAENRTLQERIRELDGELSRMQLTEGLAECILAHPHCLSNGFDAGPALMRLSIFAPFQETVHR